MKTMLLLKNLPAVLAILAISVLATGCGKQEHFAAQKFSATAVASQYTRPKIDILFVQDNSDSMRTPLASLKSQLNGFLTSMSKSWDIHFTVVPLQSRLSLDSKYIVAQDCSTISSPYCLNLSQVSSFNNAPAGTTYAWINAFNTATANTDPGFAMTQANLADPSVASTGFLRPDAALAVVMLTNGNDASGITQSASIQSLQCWSNGAYHPEMFPQYDYCDRGDGVAIMNPYSQNLANSYNSFKSYITTTLKGGAGLTRFYSVAAENNYSNCYGGPAWQGMRYIQMANDLSGDVGAHYDLCSGGLSSVLANIKFQLDSLVEAYRFNFAVIDDTSAPVESSIVVTKNGVVIPESSTNGWTYAGFKSNQPISYYPQASNFRSGYMIELHGTAEYKGTDVIHVDFQKQ